MFNLILGHPEVSDFALAKCEVSDFALAKREVSNFALVKYEVSDFTLAKCTVQIVPAPEHFARTVHARERARPRTLARTSTSIPRGLHALFV